MPDNYYTLMEKFSELDVEERYDAIADYFCEDNFAGYILPSELEDMQYEAVHTLFGNLDGVHEKVYDAIDKDVTCSEAYLIAVYVFEDLDAYTLFKDFMKEGIDYESLNDYGKQSYLRVLELFATYLIDLSNYHYALKIQSMIDRIEAPALFSIMRRAYCYLKLEMPDEFFNLYRSSNVRDPLFYLYLLVGLLKNDDEERAELVYHEMLDEYPSAEYLNHPWDGDDSKEMQMIFDALDAAMEELRSVPDFFTFIANHKSRSMYS